LSNAFKFTENGSVTLRIALADARGPFGNLTLTRAEHVIAFAVVDTGIGIPNDKQKLIFEAFQQADGTTSRHYGGTGLGLSISREISRLLGGEIRIISHLGEGSTFTLYLPDEYEPLEDAADQRTRTNGGRYLAHVPQPSNYAPREVVDDRERIRDGDRVLLIIEDDERFARILVNLAGEGGFKALVAARGDTGIAMANEFQPDAITLDVQLPVIDGLSVFEHLKRSPRTRHIPVHAITVVEKSEGAARGAFAYLEKPVNKETLDKAFARMSSYLERKVRELLVLATDPIERIRLAEQLGGGDVVITAVPSTAEAKRELESRQVDCCILALTAEDHEEGLDLAEYIKTEPRFEHLPIIVCTASALSASEQQRARLYAESVIVRSGDDPPLQLLRDTCLFLHRAVQNLPTSTKVDLKTGDQMFSQSAKKILVVDDDVRNVFAMSCALEGKGLDVIYAENGKRALEMLRTTPDVGVVLMDVMMPEMDGFEAIKAIRRDPSYKKAPIIAVTAKALKEDREKCIAAGASDYLPKPVDTAKLLEKIWVWLQ
jgi:CheY-like chemotaxis protein